MNLFKNEITIIYFTGVSFSPSMNYANRECNRNCGDQRTFIVCDVLVRQICRGNEYMKVPTEGYDTSYDGRGSVYVKYYDDEFCPKYVINYTNPDPYISGRRNPYIFDNFLDDLL